MHPWGVIFDWDGVIVDSSRQHEESWNVLAHEQGRILPEGFFLQSFGMKNEKIIPELLGWTSEVESIGRLSRRKELIYRELIAAAGLQPLPGVQRLLDELSQAEVPCAVASSTPRENITCVIERLGIDNYFKSIICSEDVREGKPHPEVFLLAASRLKLPPNRCVVIEDAHPGIEAARAGGFAVLAVATTHPARSLNKAARVVSNLSAVTAGDLKALLG